MNKIDALVYDLPQIKIWCDDKSVAICHIQTFSQHWPNTGCGFAGVSGQVVTSAYESKKYEYVH